MGRAGEPPPRDLVLIDFADEEGARFGRSLFGSSALAGTLDPAELAELRDAGGERSATSSPRTASTLDARAGGGAPARLDRRLPRAPHRAGPGARGRGRSCSAVSGCAGVERHRAHVPRPGLPRRDHPDGRCAATPAWPPPQTALAIERIAPRPRRRRAPRGGLELAARDHHRGRRRALSSSVDLRHPEAEPLAEMLSEALAAPREAADDRRCVLGGEPVWRIEPIPFDPELVELAATAARLSRAGAPSRWPAARSTTPPRWRGGCRWR